MKRIIILFFLISLWPCSAFGLSFDRNYIISDHELTNLNSITKEESISLLKTKGGALAFYFAKDLDNQLKHAGEIIFNAGLRHQINPLVLITIIQKEQGLITKAATKSSQLDWATGFACYDNRRPVSRFSGFTIQVDRTAWRLRYFLEHPWEFTYRAGQIYRINGQMVRPQNVATAALYNYTPHISGNRLFWQIWQSWFAKKNIITNGSLVRVKNDKGVWLIQNNFRRPFLSRNVFLASYSFSKVKIISQSELLQYDIGEPMTFPNYSLLKGSSGDIFLLVDGIRRKISSKDIFRKIGFNPEEIIMVDQIDLMQYPEGKSITTPYPSGALLRDKENSQIFYVYDDIKYPVIDKIILENNFPYNQIIDVDHDELSSFILGDLLKLRDGTLIKNDVNSTVYLITQGKRLPISNQETFEAMGYCWDNVLTLDDKIVNLHPIGDILDIDKIIL